MAKKPSGSKNRAVALAPKLPQRRRGKLRVAALLDAASDVFLERGFDAATMTEIAERAGASIGSLYQFFPTKESIADTLRAQYGDALCARLRTLREDGVKYSAAGLAERLIAIDLQTLAEYPAFAALMVVRDRPGQNVIEVRRRLVHEVSELLKVRLPQVPPAKLSAITVVVRQILRGVVDVAVEPRGSGKSAAEAEIQLLLSLYLNHYLSHAKSPRGARAEIDHPNL